MEALFGIVFAAILIVFVVTLARNIAEWAHNNKQPQALAKRIARHHHNHDGHMHTSRSYHVTFEYADGVQIEARVPRAVYNDICEGDGGILTMQGTRFIGFER